MRALGMELLPRNRRGLAARRERDRIYGLICLSHSGNFITSVLRAFCLQMLLLLLLMVVVVVVVEEMNKRQIMTVVAV